MLSNEEKKIAGPIDRKKKKKKEKAGKSGSYSALGTR